MKFGEFLSWVKVLFQFVRKWLFHVSLAKVATVFILTESTIIGGYGFVVKGHIAAKDGQLQQGYADWTITSGEATGYAVLIGFIILIGFLAYLFYNDKEQLRRYKIESTQEDLFQKVYIPVFTHIFNELDMVNYRYWAYNLAVDGNTTMRCDRYVKLRTLSDYCRDCQKKNGYEFWDNLIENFQELLTDLLDVFDIHSHRVGGDMYYFEKFYMNCKGYNPNYDEEFREYIEETFLIADLTFELTRLGNHILAKVREKDTSFMAEYGVLNIVDATDINKKKSLIEYKPDEISKKPYTGLVSFLEQRKSRSHVYGKKTDTPWMLDVLKRENILSK